MHSLKEKRAVVRPIVAELRRRFEVAAAEAGHLDLHRRALVGVAVVAPDAAHCAEVLDACERLVAGRPEIELLSARTPAATLRRTSERPARRAARKLADRIQVIVAETLEMRVKDPRLGFVTITDARVTGDLREATVFYTVYGDDEARADTAAALDSAKGVLRTEVGRQTGVRHTPSLAFVADAVPENAAAHRRPARRGRARRTPRCTRAAAGAAYAGEPDPYRAPRDDADDADDARWR